MPFGAEILRDGRVRFAIWAPAARRVELSLEQGSEAVLLPMAPHEEGWFRLTTDQATTGTLYRYRIDGELRVPDPASRFQPEDIHGPSQVIDPNRFDWHDEQWRGRPWEEAVIYELHVGAFSAEGNYEMVAARLDYLVELGVTAIELMPLADFPGARDWGYDGALLFAPDSCYGTPDELKALIGTAHRKGLMVMLDVVYNHFGPEGNYLRAYAPRFFNEQRHTPWGAAINFDAAQSATVRRFLIHNALYWLQEYHLDGLRLDAVHAIQDESSPDILEELAAAVREGPGRERRIHLVLENDHNAARYLTRDEQGRPRHYVAQWNDDLHHSLHVLLTGERDAYYMDYCDRPLAHLMRCLAEGFAYQGEPSRYRAGAARGESTAALPATAFVSFLQNHDQVGNRAFGERLHELIPSTPLRAALSIILLAPSPPLLFMGEEFASRAPFQFFCDFGPDLAATVSAGRRREFARFKQFANPRAQQAIPDPNDPASFQRSRLDWEHLAEQTGQEWLAFYRSLLRLRHEQIVPRLPGMRDGGECRPLGLRGLWVQWRLGDNSRLGLLANMSSASLEIDKIDLPAGDLPAGDTLHRYPREMEDWSPPHPLPPWSVVWFLVEASA
jgi:malto-oligosyltrehalose trehalohydrolase